MSSADLKRKYLFLLEELFDVLGEIKTKCALGRDPLKNVDCTL